MTKIFTSAIFLLISISLFSQIGGKYTYQFLTLPNNSRIAAMGGNNVSHYDNDINFAYSNPGLLRNGMNNKIAFNYINYVSDINFGHVSYVKNFEKAGIFAAGIQYSNFGTFLNTDAIGTILGDFVPAEYAISVSHARPLKSNDKFNFGASLKFIISDFWMYSSVGVALDAGVSYIDTSSNFSTGLVVKNLGTQITTYTKGNYEHIPIDVQIGITKRFAYAPFRFSLTAQNLLNWDLSYKSIFETETTLLNEPEVKKGIFNKIGDVGEEILRHFILGVELLPHKNFYIALGYNYRRRAELKLPTTSKLVGMSIGFGLQLAKFNISYGLASYHVAGASNHFSVGINLDAFKKTY
jgi:hypothetical protein